MTEAVRGRSPYFPTATPPSINRPTSAAAIQPQLSLSHSYVPRSRCLRSVIVRPLFLTTIRTLHELMGSFLPRTKTACWAGVGFAGLNKTGRQHRDYEGEARTTGSAQQGILNGPAVAAGRKHGPSPATSVTPSASRTAAADKSLSRRFPTERLQVQLCR